MDDLETQLRRYADQVEDAVGEVPAPAGRSHRPTSSRRSPLLLAAAAVVVVVIGVAALVLRTDGIAADRTDDTGPTVTPDDAVEGESEASIVPNVIGLSLDQATVLLQESGYVVAAVVAATPGPELVIAQVPEPGAALEPGSSVEVSLAASSSELSPLPDVVGLNTAAAIATLEAAGLRVDPTRLEEASGLVPSGFVIRTVPAAGTLVAAGAEVTIVVGEAGPESISDAAAYRAVDELLAALADGDFDRAARALENDGSDPVALREIGLVEGEGDWGTLIADYCTDALCGAAYSLGTIDRAEPTALVEVTFSSAQGPVVEWFRVFWFEGVTTVGHLPPLGDVGEEAPTTMERLFGTERPASEVVVARPTSIVWSDGGHPSRTSFWAGRSGGIADVVGGEVVFGGPPTAVLDDGYGREVSTSPFSGASDAGGSPAIFSYDEELRGLLAIDITAADEPTMVSLDGDAERRSYSASIGDRLVAITAGFGDGVWVEISERDGYAVVPSSTRRLDFGDLSISASRIAPDDSSIVLMTSPDFWAPFDAVARYAIDGVGLGRWAVPDGEVLSGVFDFDGRWIVAGLDSGRVFVVDTDADTARVVDVYAQVFFD